MQLLFLKPLLESVLNLKVNSNCLDRYQFNKDLVEKVSESRYNVLDLEKVCKELIEIYSSLKCLPILIGSEDCCNEFEDAVRSSLSNISGNDVLWVDLLKQYKTGNVSANGLYVSNRALLANGKTFQRATKISKELLDCSIRDYRVLLEVTKFSDEELSGFNIVNHSNKIANMLYAAQETSFDIISNTLLHNLGLFNNGEKWISCVICGNINIYKGFDDISKSLMRYSLDNEDSYKSFKVISKSFSNYCYGHWSTNTGIWRKVKDSNDVINFINMFIDSEDCIEIKIMEG